MFYLREDNRFVQGSDRASGGIAPAGPHPRGQVFDVERLDRGDYRLVRRAKQRNEGLVDWLLSCPEKDFFVPIGS